MSAIVIPFPTTNDSTQPELFDAQIVVRFYTRKPVRFIYETVGEIVDGGVALHNPPTFDVPMLAVVQRLH